MDQKMGKHHDTLSSRITKVNHSITIGAAQNPGQETITASGALSIFGASALNSAAGAITGTLADGTYIGQLKMIVMSNADNSSTVSIAHHPSSDPEVATFDAVDEYLLLIWAGTEWATIANTCTFV